MYSSKAKKHNRLTILIVLHDDVPATALCLAIYPVSRQENLIYSISQAIRNIRYVNLFGCFNWSFAFQPGD